MSTPPTPTSDPTADHAFQLARAEQNLPLALLAGSVAATLSAAAWAGITAATGYQIGFMAIGVGVAVGLAVRAAGRGLDVSYRVIASLLALAGCAGGNLLVACVYFAQAHQVGISRVFEVLDLELSLFLMQATFTPMDLLFYAIAIWEAWRLSVVARHAV
jgi:hypothetical protein